MAVALFSKDVDVHASAAMVVLDTYPRMMVEIIANQWRPKHVLKLTRNDKSFMQKITPLEAKMISKLDVSGYNDLDVSCIYKLIRHFKLLPVPNQGWGNKPLKADTKEEDDVERIRRYRNDILHRPRGGLSEQDGQDFFQDSYDMAKRLDISIGSPMNGFESQIKALQCLRVDKQTYIKALEKCAEYQAQLQETRDTPNVDLYYGNDIILKIGSKDSQAASGDSRCSIYIRDPSLDVNAVIQNIEDIKKTLEMGHYNVIKLDGAESGSLILHISIPNACFVTEDTLHDSLRSFLHHFFLIAGIHSKKGHSFTIVLAESERYITDTDEQDLEYLSETPLPIVKLDVNVHHSAFQNENVLYKEVNEFITKMYDAIDSNGVPINGSRREVMMITGSENDTKKQLKESDTDAQLQETRDTRKVELYYEKDTLLKLSNKDNQEASDDCGAAGETKPEGYSVDDHWRKLVMETYYNHVISTVKASEIIINLSTVLTLDEKRSIRQTERNKNSEEAMKLLLDKFDENDYPGKWTEFRSALVEADYEWIIKASEGDDVNFTELTTWQNMINIFTKEITRKIIPSRLLHDLCYEKIISQQSSEEIRIEEQNKGYISASFLLLTSLPRMHSQWYPKFMEILFLNGWDELVADVDSDEWKRLNQKHEHWMTDNTKYNAHQSICIYMEKGNLKKTLPSKFQQSCIQENYKSYKEKPIISKFNMSSIDRLEQDDGHRSRMMELSTDDRYPLYDTSDEITREKQLARTSEIQIPVTARRGQIDQTFPSVPETSVNESQPTDDEYVQPDSIMLQDVKRNLELEVNDEPEQNIPINVFEDIKIEDSDSEDDGPSQPPELLTLRSYQKELAAPGLQGKNCIIVAPTGSGKTHVALKIMLEHMNQVRARRHPKVIFLVEQGALAQQQAKMCIKYLPCKVKLITGETQRNERQKSFSEWLAKRDILVVTAQLLVNALIEQDITINDFTLMVFDECHHAHANHSYNRIMQAYMDQKIKNEAERNKLPMIVGLTASVGVGRAKTTEGAIDWIKIMMANMDAEELATVRVNIDELSEHVIVPEQVIKRTARRTKNYFGEAVGKIMEVTERYMKQSAYADGLGADKDKILKAPTVKGSDQYTQWISNLWRQTAKVFNQEARRFFTTCRTYLDLYNRALIIYEDARVKDAFDFLEDNVRKVNENIIADETDNKMNTLYKKSKVLMDHCVNDVNHQNPKLDTLRNLIAKTYKENIDSRGIVFVKTRDLVLAIQNWMKETDGLKALNPVKFVGAQASGEKGGMTKKDQDNILQYFKEGKHKLIIATSVAEEGLDIQKCNLVIRYDHVTNEIAMVQARGRGRAEESKYYVIASEEKMTAEKEELNMMREARMNQAIIHLQNFIHDNRQKFIQEIEHLQLEANIQQELENTNKGGRIIGDFEFEMRCGKCNEFICMSKDIKKIQAAHHAVIGEEIANHINTIRMPKPTFEDDNIKMGCGKVNCKKCGKNLGNIVIYRKAQFPVLKIENFLLSDSYGNTDVYKKWKNSPFVPLELSSQNLLDRARGVQYIFES